MIIYWIDMKPKKEFKTFDEQIFLLKQKGLFINDEEKLKWYLKSFNYQNIINGYNDFFMINNDRKTNKYKNISNSNGIIELFNFDRYISKLLLGDIQNIERKISTSIAYTLSSIMKENNVNDGRLFNLSYDHVTIKKIFKIQNKNEVEWKTIQENILKNLNLKEKIFNNANQDIKEIPVWSLVIHLSFGSLIYLLKIMNKNIFYKIMENSNLKNYNDLSNKEMIEIFEILKNARNRICHNNVLYNITISDKNNKINLINKFINQDKKPNLYSLVLIILKLEKPQQNNYLIEKINEKIDDWKDINYDIKKEIVNKIWVNKNHNL